MRLDLTNRRFGRLVAIHGIYSSGRHTRWICRCDCGTKRAVIYSVLMYPTTTVPSCGCYRAEQLAVWRKTGTARRTHGMCGTKEYTAWINMWARTTYPGSISYAEYDGRGIRVCRRWRSFDNFFTDMGLAPSHVYSIDRKNNDGNYNKRNCQWATPIQQANNRWRLGRRA